MAGRFLVLCAGLLFAASVHGASLEERLQRLPPPVRQTVRAQLGDDGKLGRIKRSKEDGKIVFEVTIKQQGKNRNFTITRDGAVLEKEVFLEELAPAVQSTILDTAHGAAIDEITQSSEDGAVQYEVEVVKGDSDQDFSVGRNGELLSMETSLAATPPAVQKVIQQKTDGATKVEIDKTTDAGEVVYDVTMTKDGSEQEFSVSADGEFLGADIDLDQAPAAVRKTIRAEAAGGKIGDLTKTTDEDGAYYEVEITDATGIRNVTVDADGSLDSTERPITLAQAPAAVKSALALQGGRVVDISKVTEDGDVTYQIEISKGGASQDLTLTPDGKPSKP